MSVSVKDVSAFEFNRAFAAFLKKSGKIKVPEWTDLAKQGRYKELSPTDQDWFYHRAASICRRMYIRAPVGVGQFRKVFGGRKRNGSAPSHFCISYKSLARRLIQALENLKMVEKDTNGGRRLTSQGKRDLDRIAAQLQPRKKARKTLK